MRAAVLLALSACAHAAPAYAPCLAHVTPLSHDSYSVALELASAEPRTLQLPMHPAFRVAALFRGQYLDAEPPAKTARQWTTSERIVLEPDKPHHVDTEIVLRFGAAATRRADEPNVWIVRQPRAELKLTFLLDLPKPFDVCRTQDGAP